MTTAPGTNDADHEAFLRWQDRTLSSFGSTIHLLLTLALGMVAFALHLITDKSFELTPDADPLFTRSLLLIGASVASGLLATILRLFDSRYSTRRARMRDVGEDLTEARRFVRYRRISHWLGFCSWSFFVLQTGAFGIGATLLGCSIAISKGLI